jgi:hypothetical protein
MLIRQFSLVTLTVAIAVSVSPQFPDTSQQVNDMLAHRGGEAKLFVFWDHRSFSCPIRFFSAAKNGPNLFHQPRLA